MTETIGNWDKSDYRGSRWKGIDYPNKLRSLGKFKRVSGTTEKASRISITDPLAFFRKGGENQFYWIDATNRLVGYPADLLKFYQQHNGELPFPGEDTENGVYYYLSNDGGRTGRHIQSKQDMINLISRYLVYMSLESVDALEANRNNPDFAGALDSYKAFKAAESEAVKNSTKKGAKGPGMSKEDFRAAIKEVLTAYASTERKNIPLINKSAGKREKKGKRGPGNKKFSNWGHLQEVIRRRQAGNNEDLLNLNFTKGAFSKGVNKTKIKNPADKAIGDRNLPIYAHSAQALLHWIVGIKNEEGQQIPPGSGNIAGDLTQEQYQQVYNMLTNPRYFPLEALIVAESDPVISNNAWVMNNLLKDAIKERIDNKEEYRHSSGFGSVSSTPQNTTSRTVGFARQPAPPTQNAPPQQQQQSVIQNKPISPQPTGSFTRPQGPSTQVGNAPPQNPTSPTARPTTPRGAFTSVQQPTPSVSAAPPPRSLRSRQ